MTSDTGRSKSGTGEDERELSQTERNAVWSFFGGFLLLGVTIMQLWRHPDDGLGIAVATFFSGALLAAGAFLIIIAKYRRMVGRLLATIRKKVIYDEDKMSIDKIKEELGKVNYNEDIQS